jgi:hypothetical protein
VTATVMVAAVAVTGVPFVGVWRYHLAAGDVLVVGTSVRSIQLLPS